VGTVFGRRMMDEEDEEEGKEAEGKGGGEE
jgi:hypothetical protein